MIVVDFVFGDGVPESVEVRPGIFNHRPKLVKIVTIQRWVDRCTTF